MTTSDWKKYAEDEWSNNNDKYSFAKVWKIGLSSGERKKRGIGVYAFAGRVGRTGEETKKYFKRKPQALKYAKYWMETH